MMPSTALHLVVCRRPVLWRPAPSHVGHQHLLAPKAELFKQSLEDVAGSTDERPALLVLVLARRFAQEQNRGRSRPIRIDRTYLGLVAT